METGSLTAAAKDLGTSLPTVVRTLAALEHQLGVPLLKRTTRRIHLTDEGALNRVVNLVEEGVDVAVRIAHLRDSSLVAIPVGQVRRVVCASTQFLDRHGTPQAPNDVKRYPCIRHTVLTPRSEWHFRVGQRNVTVPISNVLVSNDVESALNACVSGLGLGMFLSYMVAPCVRDGKLNYVLEGFGAEPTPVQIVYPSSKLVSSNVRAFVDECAKELRQVNFA